MIHTAVIDTNIIVSSILSVYGKPAEVMNLVYTGELRMFYTAEILTEYKKVLAYSRLNIAKGTQTDIVNALEVGGTLIKAPQSTIMFPDENDRVFYDTAKASRSILITGNLKHYPMESFIMNPDDFLHRM